MNTAEWPGQRADASRRRSALLSALSAPARTRRGLVVRIALLALLYCISGWAGLQLAQAPGYATPIWPPSGIMLALLLLWGVRTWPGVWLGSFAVNVWVGCAQAAATAGAVLPVAALIASGSTIQGLVGVALVRRFVATPTTLDSGGDVWRFFALGGLLASLIAPSAGTLTLYVSGALAAGQVPFHWLTWWVGDCMGVFLFAPLLLAAASLRKLPWQRRFGPVAAAVAISIGVGALVVQQTNRAEARRVESGFDDRARVIDHRLQATLLEAIGAVRTLADYFEASDRVTTDDFALFASRQLQRAPGLAVVGWSPRVDAAQREHYERESVDAGGDTIFELDAAGRRQAVSARAAYFPIRYVYPDRGYADVLGFDLGSDSARARTLEAAAATRTLQVSPRLDLIRGLGPGVLVVAPVAAGPEHGYVAGVIRFDALMTHVLARHDLDHITLSLIDRTAPDAVVLHGATPASAPLTWTGEHAFGGRTWGMVLTADERYLLAHRSLQAWLTQVGVLLFSALLGGFLMALTGKAAHVHKLVAERTAELRERNEALSREIAERLRHEQRLRLSAEVFEHIGEAIMITDADNRIVSVNRAFTEITGYAEDEVRGQTPRALASGHHDAAFYRDLWASLERTGSWRGEVWDRRKNGQIYPGWLNISIVRDSDGQKTHHVAVFSDISERKAAEERILYLAQVDALTNLPNRYLLGDRLQQTMESARRNGQNFAVMFVDIDRFKNINDSLGHGVGDALLCAMAERLRVSVRASDTVARHGGDEFVIVIPGIVDAEQAAHIAGKILDAVSLPLRIEQHLLTTTASIGVAIYPSDGDDVESLMKHADAAMYVAKSAGRNGFRFFTQDMNARVHEFLKTENELRRAIEHGELRVYYQPQVDVVSGEVVAAEALVRWQHPERGIILPSQFIHVAEESGLVATIGDWVLREACRQNRAWQDLGLRKIPIAVNLSALELHRDDAARKVEAALTASGLDACWLELEVTESMLMRDVAHVGRLLHALRAMGVQIALDDFGTGYSSLAHLRGFPLSALKVDRSFVGDLQADGNDAAICRAVIALGRTLGLRVIAEGVESAEQLAFLRRNHCDAVQGSLFSWAVPADEMAKFLLPSYVCPAIAVEAELL